jgi:hypothetical protein
MSDTKTTTPAPTLIDPNGKTWHPTEHQRGGGTLYVIDGVDASKVSPIVMSTRMELESIFGTELHPIGDA